MKYTNNPVVINTLKIWFQLRQNFKCENLFHLSPIHNNHLFPQAMLDSEFTLWQRRGILYFKDLYTNSIFANFDDLSHRFGLPRSSLFRYFQIRHFLQHHFSNFPYTPPPSGLENLLEPAVNSKKKYFKDIWPDNQS